jgi:acetyl-CoA synthetase
LLRASNYSQASCSKSGKNHRSAPQPARSPHHHPTPFRPRQLHSNCQIVDYHRSSQGTETRSGKIMRRLLCELVTNGEIKGNATTLEVFTVLAKLREAEEG